MEEGKTICMSSSFQTYSLPLLHIINVIVPRIPIVFIDTGFHFPETYAFRNKLEKEWDLNILEVKSEIPKSLQINENGKFFYSSNPDYCCQLNKVEPLEIAKKGFDVWVAGLRRSQTDFRKNLNKIQLLSNGQIKYHPILDWTTKEIFEYAKLHNLPAHPLEAQGYVSIGCQPCTNTAFEESERSSRWFGSKKTECGIHLNN